MFPNWVWERFQHSLLRVWNMRKRNVVTFINLILAFLTCNIDMKACFCLRMETLQHTTVTTYLIMLYIVQLWRFPIITNIHLRIHSFQMTQLWLFLVWHVHILRKLWLHILECDFIYFNFDFLIIATTYLRMWQYLAIVTVSHNCNYRSQKVISKSALTTATIHLRMWFYISKSRLFLVIGSNVT